MDKTTFQKVLKEMLESQPEILCEIFTEIKKAVKERLMSAAEAYSKESESFNCKSKTLCEYIDHELK